MWVTKLLISPVKKRIFCPKTTKFGPKLVFLVNLGQAMQDYSVPCWWVGWWLWRAGSILQDTYLLYGNRTIRTEKCYRIIFLWNKNLLSVCVLPTDHVKWGIFDTHLYDTTTSYLRAQQGNSIINFPFVLQSTDLTRVHTKPTVGQHHLLSNFV